MTRRHAALYVHRLYNGGIEKVFANLASEFLSQGVKVDIVVDSGGWGPLQKWFSNDVRLIDLKAKYFVDRPFRLARYFSKERPSAVLSASHFANETAVIAASLSGAGMRTIVSEHTAMSVEIRSLPLMHPRRWMLRPLAALAYRRAHSIVSVSNSVALDLAGYLRLGSTPINTIYNPVITADLLAEAAKPVSHPWFSEGELPVVLGVGRLEAQKDFKGLISAFARVRLSKPSRLVILGEGSLRPALVQQIDELGLQQDVLLPGFVPNPMAYMAKAKVFVLSSAWEGFGNVLVEALAIGTPIVSTNCPGGPAEILDNGRLGRLVPVNRSDLLGAAILDALTTDIDRTQTPAKWLEQFKTKHVAQRYMELMFS